MHFSSTAVSSLLFYGSFKIKLLEFLILYLLVPNKKGIIGKLTGNMLKIQGFNMKLTKQLQILKCASNAED